MPNDAQTHFPVGSNNVKLGLLYDSFENVESPGATAWSDCTMASFELHSRDGALWCGSEQVQIRGINWFGLEVCLQCRHSCASVLAKCSSGTLELAYAGLPE